MPRFLRLCQWGWLARTTIPPQYSITGVDRDIQDRTEALLYRILDKAARDAKNTTDADTRRIGLFYGSCMDSVRVDREGAKPLGSRLGRIAAIRSRAQLVGVMAELEREGVDGPIAYFAYPNFKNSRVMSYPDKWRDYSKLALVPGPYVTNYLAAQRFETDRQLAEVGKPVDRTEWRMTPPTYNAYYNPPVQRNCFPGRHPAATLIRSHSRRCCELWRHRRHDRSRAYSWIRRPGPLL